MKLVLPLPPSPNDIPSHPMEVHKAKNRYRAAAWIDAIQQAPPKALEDLPAKVRVSAVLYVHNVRDEDNGAFSACKWALDALKAKQRGKLKWKNGLYLSKGYLVDDSPKHCSIAPTTQHIDRARPRLELTIEPIGAVS